MALKTGFGAVALAAAVLASPVASDLIRDGLSVPAAAQQGDFRWSGQIGVGRTLEIKGVNGDVRAIGVSGGEAGVVAVKRGRRSDPDTVTIEVIEHADGVTICAVYPTPQGDRPNECRPGSEGRMNTRNNDVSVDFTVRVPAGVHFTGRTVNGDVEADSIDANANVSTVNGSARMSAAGYGEARTVNGSITASLNRANWTGPLEFNTVNGSITLDLPADLSADVNATTVNGSITTEFPMTVTGSFNGRRLNGAIGGGGRALNLRTVNGSIRLRRAP